MHWTTLRIVVGLGTLVFSTPFAVVTLIRQVQGGFDFIETGIGAVVGTAAFLGWWFAFFGHHAESRARMKVSLVGGIIFFVIGGLGGFFGPLILWPKSNLGPLWGIFLTGPVGFAFGTLLGWLYTLIRKGVSERDQKGVRAE